MTYKITGIRIRWRFLVLLGASSTRTAIIEAASAQEAVEIFNQANRSFTGHAAPLAARGNEVIVLLDTSEKLEICESELGCMWGE